MGEILILKSINGRILTEKLVDSWLYTNEMFVTKKSFSDDQYSVEITFIDEERADMMSDLLTTCYGDYISISRPQTLVSSLDNSFDEEREPSPIHLSSALSTSSRVTSFSQRLIDLDNKKTDQKPRLPTGRGKNLETSLAQINISNSNEIENNNNNRDDASIISNSTLPSPSVRNTSKSSGFGRGRDAVFK